MTHTGTIVDFRCRPGSGIAILVLDTGGDLVEIPCENTQTVRVLAGLFEDLVLDGHSVDLDQLQGQTVTATTGKGGLLELLEAG